MIRILALLALVFSNPALVANVFAGEPYRAPELRSLEDSCSRQGPNVILTRITQLNKNISGLEEDIRTVRRRTICPVPRPYTEAEIAAFVSDTRKKIQTLRKIESAEFALLKMCKDYQVLITGTRVSANKVGQIYKRDMVERFSQQYSNLQQKIQNESRQLTVLSNIMKTRHDTTCSAIHNAR